MKYKMSKFTYSVYNETGELLLYNTLIGRRSLCKLSMSRSDLESLLKNNESEDLLSRLYDKGIIVSDELDENAVLYEDFIKNFSPSQLTLHINPTEHCNFRCKYCYESFSQGEMAPEIQNRIVSFVRQNLHKHTGLHISWFGGEPLLSMKCISNLSKQFIEICKYYKIPYSAGITTNGYLLTEENFEQLLNLGVKRFQITIDGIKSIHDSQRITVSGKETYETIINNLLAIKKDKSKNFEIILRSNLTKEIFNNLDEYIMMLQSLCGDDWRFVASFYKVGNWMNKTDLDLLPSIIENTDALSVVYEKIYKSNFSGMLNFGMYSPGAGSCYAGKRNNFLIRPNGDIHKCTVNFELPNSKVGELKKGRMHLNNKYYDSLININQCKNFYDCFFAPVCMGTPCKVATEHSCPYTKEHLGIVLKIRDKNFPFETIK